jgi:hypothetical protein
MIAWSRRAADDSALVGGREYDRARRRLSGMDALTLYGVIAVGSMLMFYALEPRAAVFVLAFAAACVASSIYGFLQGAWPFGVLEAVWAVLALYRWRRRVSA